MFDVDIGSSKKGTHVATAGKASFNSGILTLLGIPYDARHLVAQAIRSSANRKPNSFSVATNQISKAPAWTRCCHRQMVASMQSTWADRGYPLQCRVESTTGAVTVGREALLVRLLSPVAG
ncbi:hypothetical protein, partial [Bradyrhizobium sp. UFLA06-06]